MTSIDLNRNTRCVSMSPWRQCFMRRIFAERGLAMPPVTYPIIPEMPTRPREPKAYSSIALTFIRLLLDAERNNLPYLIVFEDDAYPCLEPQRKLNAILAQHPLPEDCGLLCLGDCNGASMYRGKHTIYLTNCSKPYTPLVPNCAENKGSHSFLVFRPAFIPLVQAIMAFGVTDMSLSRICNHSNLRAYGLFYDPLFTQHRFTGGAYPSPAHRLPELYVSRLAELEQNFPLPTQQTRLLLPPAPRYLIFSNAPRKQLSGIDIRPDDVLVFINKAVDYPTFANLPNKRILIARSKTDRKRVWFLPQGQEQDIAALYDDFILLSDHALAQERPWFLEYRQANDNKIPTTGWITYRLLKDDYPNAEVIPVCFRPDSNIGTFKWPKHAWSYEAEYYRRNNVPILSCF